MIDHSTIEHILDSANIVDVIEEFVSLKKRGVNHIGLCPFHDEKTPSFTVSLSKNIYKCFGCGKAGNVVNFLMEHETLSYPDALRFLAKKYNIEIYEKEQTPEDIEQKNEHESMLVLTSFAQKYFSNLLEHNEEGKAVGLSYFKERGFREDIIKKFQLGYCLDKKDAFTNEALKNGFKIEFLESTGLTIKRDEWKIDRFKDRVIFPIHNIAGRVIGFTSRTLKNDKKIAKYVNSPDSTIYHKSKVLYGLYFAKKAISKLDKCYIVEGNTDVISLHQSGIENVVASSGTALTDRQLKLIKRFTNNVTIVFDGDDAGIKASLRGIDLILEEGLNVKVLELPENEDPDSYSKKLNIEELTDYFNKNEIDFISFKTNLLMSDAKNDPVKRAHLVNDIVKSISVIPDTILRSEYIKECSTMLNVNERVLYNEVRKLYLKKYKLKEDYTKTAFEREESQKLPQIPGFIDKVYCEAQEREIIYFLLNYGEHKFTSDDDEEKMPNITVSEYIIREIQNDELEFKNLIYKKIFEIYNEYLLKNETVTTRIFINHEDDSVRKLAADLLSKSYHLSPRWEKNGNIIESEEMRLNKDVPKSLIVYKSKILLIAEKKFRDKLTDIILKEDKNEIQRMMVKINEITKNKNHLSKSLNRIIL